MAAEGKKTPTVEITPAPRRTNSEESSKSLKSPRTPRFAEATSVNSPIDGPSTAGRSPFHEVSTTQHLAAQPQPSDVGFGYIGERASAQPGRATEVLASPRSPLKSALKSPGAPPREIKHNPLSPTWREEAALEKCEELNDKDQARDVVSTATTKR